VVLPENAQLALLIRETRPFKSVALTLGRFNAQVKSFNPKKCDGFSPFHGPSGKTLKLLALRAVSPQKALQSLGSEYDRAEHGT
jgi:hypothetical protein